MENATKALLIAAAILVAILIISLGLVVYNMAAETVQNVNLDEQVVKSFNDKFTRYEGTNKKGTVVNALYNEVLQNNLNNTNDPNKQLTVNLDGATVIATDATQAAPKVPTGGLYDIAITYNPATGMATQIDVTTL